VFGFEDNITPLRSENDKYFIENNFKLYTVDGNSFRSIRNYLESSFRPIFNDSRRDINVIIDYSCMTRVMYAEILYFFKNNISKRKEINLYFSYSTPKYTPPIQEQVYNTHVEPIVGYSDLTIPERPTALIIGLGYDKNRAYSLREYLDADKVYLFVAQSEREPKYEESVFKENADLLSNVSEKN